MLRSLELSSPGSILFSKGKRSFNYEARNGKPNALASVRVSSCSETIYKSTKKTVGPQLDFTNSQRKEAALEMTVSLVGGQRMNWST